MKNKLAVLAYVLGAFIVLAITVVIIFQTRSLQIEGNSRVSDDIIKQEIQYGRSSGNSLLLLFLNRNVDVSDNSMLESIDLELKNPWTVRVNVKEQSIVCGVATGKNYIYINSSGNVVSSASNNAYQLPIVQGLAVKGAEEGQLLETEDETALLDVAQIAGYLEEYDVKVSIINILEDHKYSLLQNDVTILLGRNIYMEEKISELGNLQDNLTGLSGVLHLENYDASKESIIFTKD